MGPILKKKPTNKEADGRHFRQRAWEGEEFFFFYYYLHSFSDVRKSDRRNSSNQERKCSMRRGLRVGTKNTGFFLEFK